MSYLASLPMYDHPKSRAWTDAWWRGIAGHLRAVGVVGVPDELERDLAREDVWRSKHLLFTQTCGYPLAKLFRDELLPLVTPRYRVPGCVGSSYCSFSVVRERDPRNSLSEFKGATCAINGPDSQSGVNALRKVVAPLCSGKPFFGRLVQSGRHIESIRLVAVGEADICAVDCVTYGMAARYEPESLAGTRILGRTALTPGLLYATSARTAPALFERVRAGVVAAFEDPALAETREALMIGGADILDTQDYDVLLVHERDALASGFDPMAGHYAARKYR